jgi:predicted GH43/DUF377 family glycosyl hydrolase
MLESIFPDWRRQIMNLTRTGVVLRPSASRVVIRPFDVSDDSRRERILARIMSLTEADTERQLDAVLRDFRHRHQRTREFFFNRFEQIKRFLFTDQPISESRRLLIGSYFTQEYALESAALFNPSMVRHPDQTGVPAGSMRFIVSLRATGEGHISSITFRSGVIDARCHIRMDEPTRFVQAPELVPNSLYEKGLFQRKLIEMDINGPITERILDALAERFTIDDLERSIRNIRNSERGRLREMESIAVTMLTLARANYEIRFDSSLNVSERIIFPSSPWETNGIEDARFVEFTHDDGRTLYYATYTAYDGRMTIPQMIETDDFLHFRMSTLNGSQVKNKGFALFPRMIGGQYAMLSRQDGENLYLMYSDQLHFWYTKQLIARPTQPWEFVQIGNCGSPIETPAGWLTLTHGVGPMRKYAIGVMLLDLEDPTRVIRRMTLPLLEADANEREGYVPNVVYSCGGCIHGDHLILPYAMADHAGTFATVPLQELLDTLDRSTE